MGGVAAVLLAAPVVTGNLVGSGAARVLACVGVTAVLLAALSATGRLWRPFLGPWFLLLATASDRRVPGAYIALRVILLALLLDLLVQAVPDSPPTAALYGVAPCAALWSFYGRRPRSMRLR
ncbi:hypothetical protein ACWDTQ_28630 [Streptomyces cellulosae]